MPADPDLELALCPVCGDERRTEQPVCPDGHGDDCPDRICVDCGTALFLDPVLTGRPARRSRHVA